MRLSKASAYGVLATVFVAERGTGRPVQAASIAQACDIPFNHLVKILQQLVRCGVLLSERGPRGGFRLARQPGEISVLDIVQGIDGPIAGESAIEPELIASIPAATRLHLACNDVASFARQRLRQSSILDLMVQQSPVTTLAG